MSPFPSSAEVMSIVRMEAKTIKVIKATQHHLKGFDLEISMGQIREEHGISHP